DRPEYLLLGDPHIRCHIVEDGGHVEESLLLFDAAAEQLGPFFLPYADIMLRLLHRSLVYERAHLCFIISCVADTQRLCPLDDYAAQTCADFLIHYQPARCGAPLAACAEGSPDYAI